MVELTDSARHCLDLYLADVRASLAPCPSVDVSDVERDVLEHIDVALAGTEGAVDSPELQGVLQKLGSPSQWVPQDEISGVRRALLALRSGPDDLRLGYICFGLLAGSLFLAACINAVLGFGQTLPFLLLGIASSFIFARACLSAGAGCGGVDRWLIYPSLLVVYVPVSAVLLLGPLALASLPDYFLKGPGATEDIRAWWRFVGSGTILALSFLTFASLWWAILLLVAWRWPSLVRTVFAPFARHFRGRTLFLVLSVICLLIFLGCVEFWHLQVQRIRDMQAHPAPSSPAPARNTTASSHARS
ncbi:MAG: hypothetical protein ACP5XB_30600 [Isosphaeraceae bacterium]